MARLTFLMFLLALVSACASTPRDTACASKLQTSRTAHDAAMARLRVAEAAADATGTPDSFGKVASAAADVAGTQTALDSAVGECGIAP